MKFKTMEEIFSDILDSLETTHKQGLQALKEYKIKNPDFNEKEEKVYLGIKKAIYKNLFKLASDKCIYAVNDLI